MGGATGDDQRVSALSAVAVVGFIAAARRRFTVAETYSSPLTMAMIVLVPARTYPLRPAARAIRAVLFSGGESQRAIARSREWRFGRAFRIVAACILVFFVRRTHPVHTVDDNPGRRRSGCRSTRKSTTVTDWLTSQSHGPGSVATSTTPGLVYLAHRAQGRRRWRIARAKLAAVAARRSSLWRGLARGRQAGRTSLPYQTLLPSRRTVGARDRRATGRG